MKKLKFLIKCILVVIIPFALNFLFVGDVNSYTRVMLSELYADGEIDLLFLGPSHTYRGINTQIVEEQTGLNAFNAGSSSQQLQGSYYLLKEANENNGVKMVFLDVTYILNGLEKDGKTQTYILTDYMQGKDNKYEYLWNTFGIEGILNDILPIMHGQSFSLETIKEHITREYLNNSYEYITYSNEAYYGQGFVYSYEVVDEDFTFYDERKINPEAPLSNYSKEYLQKIIEYCNENGIELFLIDPPMPDGTLVMTEYYQLYVDEVSAIAEKAGIEYWNFNLIKEDILTLERTDYKDAVHLNGIGAEKYTDTLCDIFNGVVDNPFYKNYSQKLLNNPDNTIG